MFVERGNVAVLQCGVPASVRDSVEVRTQGNDPKYKAAQGGFPPQSRPRERKVVEFQLGAWLVERRPARKSGTPLGGKVTFFLTSN